MMICFSGSFRCHGPVIFYFPLTPILTWMEWPWVTIVPTGMFTGTLWGRIFILSSIGLNAGLIFGGTKLCQWLFPRFIIARAWAQHARWIRSSLKRRLLEPRPRIATIAALIYLIPALVLWLHWQYCSGWKWLCSAPLLESFARPWADWLGWPTVDHSNLSVAASLGVLGARLFVLAALFLNAGVIFSMTKWYEWMVRKLRNNPSRLIGTMCAVTYALLALFVYVDQYRCSGFLCDLYLLLAAAPWSILIDVHYMRGGMFLVLLMLAANAVILYAVSAGLARLFLKSA